MILTAQQIERAWRQLEDGTALEDVQASWGRLTEIRRELDEVVVALAEQIEYLRAVAAAPAADAADTDNETKEEAG